METHEKKLRATERAARRAAGRAEDKFEWKKDARHNHETQEERQSGTALNARIYKYIYIKEKTPASPL